MYVIINIIVAVSNLSAILMSRDINFKYKHIIYYPMIASYLYHLAETKHNLIGIYPLNLYSGLLLNIDRFFAIYAIAHVLYIIYKYPILINNNLIVTSIIGTGFLLYSECDVFWKLCIFESSDNISLFKFMCCHCIWHLLAFYLLTNIVKKYSLFVTMRAIHKNYDFH